MTSEEACAGIRRMIAERGWTWNILSLAYYRLTPDLTWHEKIRLYGELRQLATDSEETEVCDRVLASQDSVFYITP
jgi:hypothetical protein